MGAECPNGHGMQNIVANITADGTPPKRSTDVIATRLRCGCVVGGQEYTDFQEAVAKAHIEENTAIQSAKKAAQDKKAAAYKAFVRKEA